MFSIIPDGAHFQEFALLKDGQGILLRTACPADVDLVEAFMNSLSRETLALRFMGGVSRVSRKFVEDLCDENPHECVCLLAVEGMEADQRIVGLGNYVGKGDGIAEVSFVVADEHQGRGISSLILERLAGLAAGAGYVGFEADLLYKNAKMANVFRDSGFETQRAMEGDVIHLRFPLSAAQNQRERAEYRERVAAANSLAPLLKPATVAVVGASRSPGSIGNALFRHILQSHFKGVVYPVNPMARAIEGVAAYPTLASLPEAPDLVILAVAAPKVIPLAEEALDRGARGLLVIASGFAEAGPEGALRQERLVRLVRSRGARLVGPNCLGLLNTNAAVQLNASLAANMPPRGRVGFFSHSAALGVVILQYAAERGLGFSTFVSAGNRADVSGNDLLQYWEEDPDTDVALLYLETFGSPRRFARLARRISKQKPVLCVKSARSHTGRRTAQAHIGASPRNDAEVEALFLQAGVIRADTLEELFDIAQLLSHQPLPRGNRVAIIANSGGVATICADACESRGMLISGPGVVNLHALATPEHYERACLAALEHPDVDALIATFACLRNSDPALVARAIRRAAVHAERKTGIAKPTLLSLMGVAGAVPVGPAAQSDHGGFQRTFPSYRFPESAAMALSKVVDYARFRLQPPGRIPTYENLHVGPARLLAERLMEGLGEAAPLLLSPAQTCELMESFGIPIADGAPGDSGIAISLSADPDFGPIWRFHRPGQESILRITPLTDLDIADVLTRLQVPHGCGLAETLGRLTHLVEELPWICTLEAEVLLPPEPDAACHSLPLPLQSGMRVALARAEYRMT